MRRRCLNYLRSDLVAQKNASFIDGLDRSGAGTRTRLASDPPISKPSSIFNPDVGRPTSYPDSHWLRRHAMRVHDRPAPV